MSEFLSSLAASLASTYEIQREVGHGGMATVFLARDIKHDRQVAVKVLAHHLAASIAHERFLREIRVAARLTHPHIVPLLDSGEVNELPYYVMPFVDGESLRERLTRAKKLDMQTAISIISEIGDALHYAHAAGIIHRDVKPDNIMMLGEHAVIMDFGVARAMYNSQTDLSGISTETSMGLGVGTPAYMSPEQASPGPLDGRSDEYSLAVVLFELLSGTTPFSGPTSLAVLGGRFAGAAPRLRERCPDAPRRLEDAVARALQLEPADRFNTVADFVQAVREAFTQTTISGAVRVDAADASVAVLPFSNLSNNPDNEYFSDGITEEIITSLGRIKGLRVAARSSSFAFKGRNQDVRRVGAVLGVRTVLEGSVHRWGQRVKVMPQLIDASEGFVIWSDSFDRQLDDVFAIQEEIARAVVLQLHVRLLGQEARPFGGVGTGNNAAYDAYLRGRYDLNRRTEESLRHAVAQFELSIAHDPTFAHAHAALGDGLMLLGLYGALPPRDAMPRARAAATAALAIDPSLAEPHATLGSIAALHDYDWAAAEACFDRASRLSPSASAVHHRFAMDCLLPQRRFDDALGQVEEACVIDPLSLIVQVSRGVVHHLSGDLPRSLDALRAVALTDPSFAMAHYFLGAALRDAGDFAASLDSYRAAIHASGGTPEMRAGMAQSLAMVGEVEEARAILASLEAEARTRFVSPCLLAQIYLSLGERERPIELIEQAAQVRDPELVFMSVRAVYAPLRGQDRFEVVRRAVGAPAADARPASGWSAGGMTGARPRV